MTSTPDPMPTGPDAGRDPLAACVEAGAKANWLAWLGTNPHGQKWEELSEDTRAYWRSEARTSITGAAPLLLEAVVAELSMAYELDLSHASEEQTRTELLDILRPCLARLLATPTARGFP